MKQNNSHLFKARKTISDGLSRLELMAKYFIHMSLQLYPLVFEGERFLFWVSGCSAMTSLKFNS